MAIFRLSTCNFNDFSLNLYKVVANSSENKNVVISPASIALATGLILHGVSGETHKEIERALGDEKFENLIQKMENDSSIESANKILVSLDFNIKKSYQETVERIFKSAAHPVHFRDERTLKIINQWIEGKTKGSIKDAIAYLDPSSVAVIINVIYFKGNWQHRFELDYEMDFHYSTTMKSKMQFMDLEAPLRFADLEKVQIIELPYENTDISLVIMLPKEIDGLKDLEEGLTVENLNTMLSKMDFSELVLAMPRFKIEFEIQLEEFFKKVT